MEAVAEVAVPTKKVRVPKTVTNAETGEVTTAEKKVRVPKAPKAPKLDAEGNPIPKRERMVLLGSQKLRITEKGYGTSYRGKRGELFMSIKDGMTVEEFLAQHAEQKDVRSFLVWYIGDAGVVEVE